MSKAEEQKRIEQLINKLRKKQYTTNRVVSNIEIKEAKELFWHIARLQCYDFKVDKYNKKIITDILLWLLGKDGSYDLFKGFYIFGGYGRGKTLLMRVLEQWTKVVKIKGTNFRLISTRDLVQEMVDAEATGCLRKYRNRPYCFDDVGREYLEYSIYGNKIAPMEMVFDYCYYAFQNQELIYHVTSNLSPEDIGATYGDRTLTIFNEMFNFINLTGKDRRI